MEELGYFPGMPQMLEEARREIDRLLDQNAKLIADNTTLTRMAAQQSNQMQAIRAEYNHQMQEYTKTVQALQTKIQQLRAERDHYVRVQQQQ